MNHTDKHNTCNALKALQETLPLCGSSTMTDTLTYSAHHGPAGSYVTVMSSSSYPAIHPRSPGHSGQGAVLMHCICKSLLSVLHSCPWVGANEWAHEKWLLVIISPYPNPLCNFACLVVYGWLLKPSSDFASKGSFCATVLTELWY